MAHFNPLGTIIAGTILIVSMIELPSNCRAARTAIELPCS